MLFNTVLFTGNANPALAQEIATSLGIELGKAKVGRFSDGEVDVEIQQNVRARDVFVVQSTCAPTNENLMELLIMVDALKRASARRITAVIPYFGYARQDRRPRSHARADQRQGGGQPARDRGRRARADDGPARRPDPGLLRHPGRQHLRRRRCCWRTCRARTTTTWSSSRPTSAAWCARARWPSSWAATWPSSTSAAPKANVSEVMHVIGEIEGRNCVIMDDMIDTAGTLVKAAEVLKERGAKKRLRLLHARRCSRARRSSASRGSQLDEVVITNTIPLSATRPRRARRSASCRWPSCSPRRSAASPTASR